MGPRLTPTRTQAQRTQYKVHQWNIYFKDTTTPPTLHRGDCTYSIQFHIFKLGSIELILGLPWMMKIGPFKQDVNKQTLKFKEGGKKYTHLEYNPRRFHLIIIHLLPIR